MLKVLLFLEEHGEAYDGTIYQQPPNDRHDHGGVLNERAVGKQCREG